MARSKNSSKSQESQEDMVQEKTSKKQNKGKTAEPKGKSKKSTKESSKDETRRTKKSRDDISDAGIRKIFIQASQDIVFRSPKTKKPEGKEKSGKSEGKTEGRKRARHNKVRISDNSIGVGRSAVNSFLRTLAKSCQDRLNVSNKKTLTEQMVQEIITGTNGGNEFVKLGIVSNDLYTYSNGSTNSSHPLSLSGVMRTFRRSLKECNISREAKHMVLGAGIAYLRHLGRASAIIASNGGRVTISSRDVESSLAIRYRC